MSEYSINIPIHLAKDIVTHLNNTRDLLGRNKGKRLSDELVSVILAHLNDVREILKTLELNQGVR